MESAATPYRFKAGRFSSHGRILGYLAGVPLSVRILEIGTAQGYLGQAIRQLGFRSVTGLERDPLLARAARPFYDGFLELDLDRLRPSDLPDRFDLILCADVLEHLANPWKVLRVLRDSLGPDGRILLSVPNAGHAWVRLNVLLGRFPLEERGLFDRGHLHFFTWRTLSECVGQAGLTIERRWITPVPFSLLLAGPQPVVRTPLSEAAALGFLGGLGAGCESLYTAFAVLWKRLFAYQFVLLVHRRVN